MRMLAAEAVVILLLLASAAATYTTSTSPSSSVSTRTIKPPFHRCNWCGINAVCYANLCKCFTGFYGNPYFICYKPVLYDFCQLCDDPVVTTENGESVSPHYLDSTLLMDKWLTTRARTCQIRAAVTNYRVQGKSYPKCVFIRLDLKSRYTCVIGFQICGYSRPDGYVKWVVFVATVSKGRTSLKTWRTIQNGATATYTYRSCGNLIYFKVSKGKILTLRATCCPITLGFRPFVKRIDWLKTGIFILTPKTRNKPLALPKSVLGFPICLRPGLPLSYVQTNLGLPNRRQAMAFLAQTNLPSDLLPVSSELTDLKQSLLGCPTPKLQTLYREANFVVSRAPFIRDISGTTGGFAEILKVAKKTADWFCEDEVDSCRAVIKDIDEKARGLLKQPKRFPKLVAFRKRNCAQP